MMEHGEDFAIISENQRSDSKGLKLGRVEDWVDLERGRQLKPVDDMDDLTGDAVGSNVA